MLESSFLAGRKQYICKFQKAMTFLPGKDVALYICAKCILKVLVLLKKLLQNDQWLKYNQLWDTGW